MKMKLLQLLLITIILYELTSLVALMFIYIAVVIELQQQS